MKQNQDTPLDVFKLFFTDEILKHMLDQTNVYASQKNTNLNMDMDEMKVFIGGLLLLGYAKYPNKRMYCSGQEDIPKIFQNNMHLNRSEQILRHFHLNDNINIDNFSSSVGRKSFG
ncbi:hypothetical protein JTB14_015141 [Gonioctena quinquepunctata]|nr:hypothetical protein JTB14_015141 [Gonioctena quinquepunctata]